MADLKGSTFAGANSTFQNNSSVISNSTTVTLRNETSTQATPLQGFQHNYSSPFYGIGNGTEPIPHFNVTVWYSEPDSVSFDYIYVLYWGLLLLLLVAVMCIKLGVQKRNERLRRAEAQRRADRLRAAFNARENVCYSTTQHSPKEDLPPKYDDIMISSFVTKQSFPNTIDFAQVPVIGNTSPTHVNSLPASISMLTIATDISHDNEPQQNMSNNMTTGNRGVCGGGSIV